jgi:hypothetical protein
MSVGHGSRPETRKVSSGWWPVTRGLLLLAGWVVLFVLFVHQLPALLDWVSDQADRGWLVPALAGWALFALPALVAAAVSVRVALLEQASRRRGDLEGFVSRCLIAVALVPTVAFLPGRLTTTRTRWQHTASSGGFHFHRGVQWTFLGEFVLLTVCAFVVLRRLHAGSSRGTWTATAILLPPPLIMLMALLVAGP